MADDRAGSADKKICGVPEKVQLHVAMLALQFGYAGFHVVSRAALNMGISKVVFPVYRNIIALILLVPFAYFFEKKDRPTMTLTFLLQFFFLALCGITANQGFYLLGLDYTSPTFASAIQNSVPAITFLMAAVLNYLQDRESADRPKRRRGEAGGHFAVCGWRVGDNSVQGPNHLLIFVFVVIDCLPQGPGRVRPGDEELDPGLRLLDRPLPLVVRMARSAGPVAEEVPGQALRHFLHLLLRRAPVSRHSCLH
ncbi:putative protein WALLS ARE THIN 1 [Iris pallida]|uniref:WAT1-related protein n=1 Tax=Iris pallida TaxID=29817 RepID=A0AAX6FM80_IRIPA|nr:putative protein WALLS ARE THIN 1 [Iris pallida]